MQYWPRVDFRTWWGIHVHRSRATADVCVGPVSGHPFARGVADGTLPAPVYQYYVGQNLLYLPPYARAVACAVTKSRSDDELRRYSTALVNVVDVEIPAEREAPGAGARAQRRPRLAGGRDGARNAELHVLEALGAVRTLESASPRTRVCPPFAWMTDEELGVFSHSGAVASNDSLINPVRTCVSPPSSPGCVTSPSTARRQILGRIR